MHGLIHFGKLRVTLRSGQAANTGAAFSTATCAATNIAGFLVIFAATHLFFDSRMLDQLAESLNSILNRLVLTQTQLNHKLLLEPSSSLLFDNAAKSRKRRLFRIDSGHIKEPLAHRRPETDCKHIKLPPRSKPMIRPISPQSPGIAIPGLSSGNNPTPYNSTRNALDDL